MSRAFCFTWNNYPADAKETIEALTDACAIVVGKEVSGTGTPHLQGYISFRVVRTFAYMRTRLPGAHIESARNRPSSKAYCRKGTGTSAEPVGADMLIDFDNEPGQGQRSDLQELREALDKGGLPEAKRSCPLLLMKYSSGARTYDSINIPSPDDRNVRVVVYLGNAGIGKSRAAMSQCVGGNGIVVTSPGKLGDSFWIMGYRGEPVLVLDEFRGTIPYGLLLRILDRLPINDLPVKFGTGSAHWTKVIITTNLPWMSWYKDVDLGPLARRLHTGGVFEQPPWDLGVLQY